MNSRSGKNRKAWSGITTAKMRWKMLAKALRECRSHDLESMPGTLRSFTSFGLLEMVNVHKINMDEPKKGRWYNCAYTEFPCSKLCIRSFDHLFVGLCICFLFSEQPILPVHVERRKRRSSRVAGPIGLLSERITVDDLKGFDNTGNICLWPSEEILAYYCLKNKEMFSGKSVCELGGGMTCLSGLVVAAAADAQEVYLTDGNLKSVQNVQIIINQNNSSFGRTIVQARLLRWDVDDDFTDLKLAFDVILCADCLYFDEGRIPLVNTIWTILKEDGMAVMLAPERGSTFQQFVDLAQSKFHIERLMVYDTHVWDLHKQFQEERMDKYDENIHYPQMLILKKDVFHD